MNYGKNANKQDFMKCIEEFGLKLVIIVVLMKVSEYKRQRSFFDLRHSSLIV